MIDAVIWVVLIDEEMEPILLENEAEAKIKFVNPAPADADRALMVVVNDALVTVSLVENELEYA
jgi:hypothetical protein